MAIKRAFPPPRIPNAERNPVTDAVRDRRLLFFNPPEQQPQRQQYIDAWSVKKNKPPPDQDE